MKRFNRKTLILVLILLIASTGFGLRAENDLPKVKVITTGGTIASVKGPEGMRPAYTEKELLEFVPDLKEIAHIEGKLLFSLDSTNMQPGDWLKIAEEVKKAQEEGVRGIVITHGTDTMAYTASALTYLVQNPKIPIVITGAMKSINEKNSDGPSNLTDAVEFAANGPGGVFIVFDGKVFKGNRVSKIRTTSNDAYASINAPLVAEFVEEEEDKDLSVKKIDWPKKNNLPTKYDIKVDPKVLIVKLTPGYEPEWLDALCNPEKVHGIVIEGFGLGNIPNRKPCNLLPSIEKLQKAGIPVVVMSQCTFEGVDMSVYQVGEKAKNLGIIPGGTMSKEAAVTKLMWVLAHTRDLKKIRKMMLTDVSGELKDYDAKEVIDR